MEQPDDAERGTQIADRYLALFDILGFQSLIQSGPLEDVVRKFDVFEFIASELLATATPKDRHHLEFRIFQDSLVALSRSDTKEDLESLLWFSQILVAIQFGEGIFLRGAICHGPVFVNDAAVLGAPIVNAYQMSLQQDWVGCWVDDQCVKRHSRIFLKRAVDSGLLLKYPLPLKAGTVTEQWVINWPHEMESAVQSGWKIFEKHSPRTWDVHRKVENTRTFLKWYFSRSKRGRTARSLPEWINAPGRRVRT